MLTKVDKETFAKLEQDNKIALLATTDPQAILILPSFLHCRPKVRTR